MAVGDRAGAATDTLTGLGGVITRGRGAERMLPERVTDAATAADAALERTAKMAEAGQGRAALANCRHAVTLYRGLAEKQPEVFQPDLAVALGVLSEQLSETGAADEAVWIAAEAVDLFRGLVAGADPEAELFLPYLGAAIGTWALRLHDARRDDEALAAAREAIALFDEAGPEDRQRHHTVLDRVRVLRLTLAPDERH